MSRTLHNFLSPNGGGGDDVIIMTILGSHKFEEIEEDIICGSFRDLCGNSISVKCYNTLLKGLI
jgi:hypothetical protein